MRQMNLRLDNVLRDVTGESGQAIIKAILAGERDSKKLADLANYKVKKSKEEISKALTGDWRKEFILELKHSFELYHIFRSKISECDAEIEELLKKEIRFREQSTNTKRKRYTKKDKDKKKVNKNDPKIELEKFCYQLSGGIDLMEIPAIGRNTLLSLVSEVGFDLSKFPTAKQFSSWLGLSPNSKVSGGKVISSHTPKRKNRLSESLQRAANVIGNMKDNSLTDFFNRVTFKKGRMSAITATARKLSVIIWKMLTKKETFKPVENIVYKEKIRIQRIKNIKKQLTLLNINKEELFC